MPLISKAVSVPILLHAKTVLLCFFSLFFLLFIRNSSCFGPLEAAPAVRPMQTPWVSQAAEAHKRWMEGKKEDEKEDEGLCKAVRDALAPPLNEFSSTTGRMCVSQKSERKREMGKEGGVHRY